MTLDTGNQYTYGGNIAVDEDVFSYITSPNNVPKPGLVKIMEPLDTILNYFEFKIISGGAIFIGVGASDYPLDVMPGWGLNSVGYHAIDGKCFAQSQQGIEFGPTCTVDDRMGCGVDFRTHDVSLNSVSVFFTKNGDVVGDSIWIKVPTGGLQPLIGMCSEGDKVQYSGRQLHLPQVKLHTNSQYACGSNATVDEDLFTYNKVEKIFGKNPGIVKILKPMDSTLNYFEFKILSGGKDCALGIGVGASDYPLDRMPGWNLNSIGYHANNGKCFHQCGHGIEFGPACAVGDRMGCGIDFRSDASSSVVNVFFTKNGELVDDAVMINVPAGGLYPLIGICSEGEQVQYLGHWHYLPQTLKVKLHTNGRYDCGQLALVDEDVFMWNKCLKDNDKIYSDGESSVVRIMAPMDSKTLQEANLNYFEFKIVSSGKQCAIGIGVGAVNYGLNHQMPGWNYNSIGYHADDGKLFCENGSGMEFGPTCTAGDRMGCGLDFRGEDDSSGRVKIFFTKNSQQVGGSLRIKIPVGGLYPLIGMSSEGEQVQYLGHWHYLPPIVAGEEFDAVQVHTVRVHQY